MFDKSRQMSFDFAKKSNRPSWEDGNLEIHGKRIAGYLTVRLPEPVDVAFTNNRSTMVSFKRKGGRLSVRLHKLFRLADDSILEALAMYIGKKDNGASELLDIFIKRNKGEIKTENRKRKTKVHPKGRYYDLSEVLEKLNESYFSGEVDVLIGWGRLPRKGKRKRTRRVSRALATYSFDDKTIRVSPVLDSKDVPDFIIEWVVYHEMLHHVIPIEENQGRMLYHTDRFKNLEKAFARYEEAKKWEKDNIEKLLA